MLFKSNPVSATCVSVTSWSAPKFITAASARKRSLNSKELVPSAAPSEASGTNAVFAVIVVPTIVVAELAPIVAPSTVPPLMSAVSATSASVVTVPSKYASLNSTELVPKSMSLSVTGTIAPSCIRICSTALEDTCTKTPKRLLVLSVTILFRKS